MFKCFIWEFLCKVPWFFNVTKTAQKNNILMAIAYCKSLNYSIKKTKQNSSKYWARPKQTSKGVIISMVNNFVEIIIIYFFTVDKKMFYIAFDKANWSQPKMEKSYIYIKRKYNFIYIYIYIYRLFIKTQSCGEIK